MGANFAGACRFGEFYKSRVMTVTVIVMRQLGFNRLKVPWMAIPRRGTAKRRTRVRMAVPVVAAVTAAPVRSDVARGPP